MYCSKCGAPNTEEASFCSQCGCGLGVTQNTSGKRQKSPGESAAVTSLVLGILGLMILPIFGPFALYQSGKAKKLGYTGGMATAGQVLGWVGTAYCLLFVFVLLISMIAAITSAF